MVWVANHFWWFEILPPYLMFLQFLCLFIFVIFVNIVSRLEIRCVASEYIFLVWRWCTIMVIFVFCDVCRDNDNFRCQHGSAWHFQLGCHGGLIDLIANDSNHMIVASTWVGIDDIWRNLLNQNMHSINNIKSHPNKLCHGSKLVKVYQWWQKWHTP